MKSDRCSPQEPTMDCSKIDTVKLNRCDSGGMGLVWSSMSAIVVNATAGHERWCWQNYHRICEDQTGCSDLRNKPPSCTAEEESQRDCYGFIGQCELYEASSPAKFHKYTFSA